MPVTRQDLVLAAMSVDQAPFTVVQVQKLLCLIDHEAGLVVGILARASFPVHQFWLFDGTARRMLSVLAEAGHIAVHKALSGSFALTPTGEDRGIATLNEVGPKAREYFQRASGLIRSFSRPALMSTIRKAHPEIR
jgi:hypothetical protein